MTGDRISRLKEEPMLEPFVIGPFRFAIEVARTAENSRHVSSEPKRCVSGK
jgi:hypothetical protein